jgi:hypothetical protein
MLTRALIALAFATCRSSAAPPPPPPPPAAPVAPAPAFTPSRPDARLAALELDAEWSECSGAGGYHASLAIDGLAMHRLRYVHAGGHASYTRFGAARFGAGKRPASGWFVGEIVLAGRTDEDHDRNPDSSRSGWCLDGMPRFDGQVLRLWPARDEADARAQVRAGAPVVPPLYAARWLQQP